MDTSTRTAPTGKSANNENNNIEYQWYGAHHNLREPVKNVLADFAR